MQPTIDKCHHAIPITKNCPWCERKGQKGFPIRHVWQMYQGHFTAFVNEAADQNAQVPVAIAILAEDANGEIFVYKRGPERRVTELVTCYAEVLNERKEAESCFVDKLKNGIGKLFN